jgi:hypothetical protein
MGRKRILGGCQTVRSVGLSYCVLHTSCELYKAWRYVTIDLVSHIKIIPFSHL